MCSYVDAFGADVSEEALTSQKGKSDAEKAFNEGRLIVIGGYDVNEQFTQILFGFETRYPKRTIQAFVEQAYLRGAEQRFLTEALNEDANGIFSEFPEMALNDDNPDVNCHSVNAIAYADSFNSRMVDLVVE